MRGFIGVAILFGLFVPPASASDTSPEVMLEASGPADLLAGLQQACVAVEEVGTPRRDEICTVWPADNTDGRPVTVVVPPLLATSADMAVGLYNQAAVRQQFGISFGVSLAPQRPVHQYSAPAGLGR